MESRIDVSAVEVFTLDDSAEHMSNVVDTNTSALEMLNNLIRTQCTRHTYLCFIPLPCLPADNGQEVCAE